jgi:hypothetical protein
MNGIFIIVNGLAGEFPRWNEASFLLKKLGLDFQLDYLFSKRSRSNYQLGKE